MSKRFSSADVASHNKADNLWIVVDEDVYDLTKFQDEHPGGKKSKSFKRPTRLESFLVDMFQSSSASQAKMHRSNSGSTTTRASSRNTKSLFKSAHWIPKPHLQLLRLPLRKRKRLLSRRPSLESLCLSRRLLPRKKQKPWTHTATLCHMPIRPGINLYVFRPVGTHVAHTDKAAVPLSLL